MPLEIGGEGRIHVQCVQGHTGILQSYKMTVHVCMAPIHMLPMQYTGDIKVQTTCVLTVSFLKPLLSRFLLLLLLRMSISLTRCSLCWAMSCSVRRALSLSNSPRRSLWGGGGGRREERAWRDGAVDITSRLLRYFIVN